MDTCKLGWNTNKVAPLSLPLSGVLLLTVAHIFTEDQSVQAPVGHQTLQLQSSDAVCHLF